MAIDGKPIAGIDFGTTTSAIGFYIDGAPSLITLDSKRSLLPSITAYTKTGEVLVGDEAKKQAILNPERTFRSIKRRLGDAKKNSIDGKKISNEQIGAEIVARLKSEAERALGTGITEAVITVPAYFNQSQRKSVQEIGKLAGLNVLRIINEPTAAAMAYGINLDEEQNILVFDFGGGTFDVSILTIADGVFEVLATGGDNLLGGDDIDQLIIDDAVAEFKVLNKIDLTADKLAMQKLRDEAEKLKIGLSEKSEAMLDIPFISADENGPIHLKRTYSLDTLNEMIGAILKKLIDLTLSALKDSGLDKKEIQKVLLVGGSTRIPAVRDSISDIFGEKILAGINPVECVALGSAIQAAILGGKISKQVLVDITPLTLGLAIDGGAAEPVIPRNSTIPASYKKIFSTVTDDQTEVELRIYQGNSDRIDENIHLGKFILGGIKKAKKGEPKIEVEFEVNVDGIMNITAKDTKTGTKQSITIESDVTKIGGSA
jgi:molecular chaperone DnaK